jgi:hypothetical protein
MKLKMKSLTGGALGLAIVSGMLLGGMASASAAAPSFEPDPAASGTVALYDALGNQITSGSVNDSPLAAYYVASGTGFAGDIKANVAYATPQDGVPTASWTTVETWTSSQNFPNHTYPGVPGTTNNAVVKGSATDGGLATHITNFPSASATNPGVYQIRLYTLPGDSAGTYYSMDVKVTGTTWTQVYPNVVATTTTTLASSANPSIAGSSVTLTATETGSDSTHPAGSVVFKDGGTTLATVAVNGSGVATTTSSFALGSHSLSAIFTPTDLTSYSGSTGTLTQVANPPATPTNTALTIGGGNTTAGSDTTLTATVTGPGTTPNGAGTVAFYDNGSAAALPGTVTPGPTGTYVLDLATGFAAGPHSIVAKFTPTDVTSFQASQSGAQAFTTLAVQVGACAQPGSVCTDVQNIQATIPVGTLVINTPYTAAHPLDLGNLVLQPNATEYKGTGAFTNIIVTDTRAGNLPYTVSAQSSNLTDGGSNTNSVINSQNVGLTGLSPAGSSGFSSPVHVVDNPAADPAVGPAAVLGAPGQQGLGINPHSIVTVDHGLGTLTMNGTLTITAPTSTEAGLFTGTITFTVG